MSYGRAEAGVKCDQSAVVGWAGFGGDANRGLGGRTDVGGGRRRTGVTRNSIKLVEG